MVVPVLGGKILKSNMEVLMKFLHCVLERCVELFNQKYMGELSWSHVQISAESMRMV